MPKEMRWCGERRVIHIPRGCSDAPITCAGVSLIRGERHRGTPNAGFANSHLAARPRRVTDWSWKSLAADICKKAREINRSIKFFFNTSIPMPSKYDPSSSFSVDRLYSHLKFAKSIKLEPLNIINQQNFRSIPFSSPLIGRVYSHLKSTVNFARPLELLLIE